MLFGLSISKSYKFKAVYNYLWFTFSPKCLGTFIISILLICLVYQIIYFNKMKKDHENNGKN